MTAIICFNSSIQGAVFLADSRLSYPDTRGQIGTVRDICQKLWVPNGWSVLGFAGDLCLGNDLARAFFGALRDKPWTRGHMLTSDEAVITLALSTVKGHAALLGAGHDVCANESAGLLLAYTDLVTFNDDKGVFDHCELGTRTLTVIGNGYTDRQGIGAAVLGDGAEVIKPALSMELTMKVASEADPALQSLMALALTSQLIDTYKVPSVGQPFQIAHLSRRGVEVMPYFYWARVTRRFGTYVAMRVDDGDWIQEHRPTGRRIRIRRPFEILNQELEEGAWPLNKKETFEPHADLYNTSPGVIRESNLQLAYAVYNPPAFPKEIAASWGPEPPAMLTWATNEGAPTDEDAASD